MQIIMIISSSHSVLVTDNSTNQGEHITITNYLSLNILSLRTTTVLHWYGR